MQKNKFKISGMTCAGCAAFVDKTCKEMNGVASCEVNLATEMLHVHFDESVITGEEIKRRIDATGYKLTDITEGGIRTVTPELDDEARSIRRRLIIAVIFTLPIFYLAMSHMLPFGGLPIPSFLDMHDHALRFALVQLILSVPVLLAGYRFYTRGFKLLIKRSPNMDSLIAIGTSAAFLYGVYAVARIISGDHAMVHQLYFESSAVVVTLVMVGKYLEAGSKSKTSEAIQKLMNLTPKTAERMDGDDVQTVDVSMLEVGDRVLVRPGASIPADGIVEDGVSSVDEALVTGESMPVRKEPESFLIGGSVNVDGRVIMRVTRVGEDTMVSQIIKLVMDAQAQKAPISRLADRISLYFVPAVLIIAILAGLGWLISTQSFDFALKVFVSVLVISCPCALGLATPTAIMVASGKGASLGVLFKGGEALETTGKIKAIVLDKTGTVTEGRPTMTDFVIFDNKQLKNFDENELFRIVASAESASEHPISGALVSAAVKKGIIITQPDSFTAVPGRGIRAIVDGHHVLVGNEAFIAENEIDTMVADKHIQDFSESGKTTLIAIIDGVISAAFAVSDEIKSGAAEAVRALRKMGIHTVLLTGDNRRTANAVAAQIGVDETISEVMPQDKADKIKSLQQGGRLVAMVGDGINDAPALAVADVGIAIGTGTDIAALSSDVIAMKGDPNEIVAAITLSKATIRNVKQNLFWAFIFNTIGIPVAAGILHIFGGPLLDPMFAGFAMAMSSLLVVSNALRLRSFRL
ncbi:MAG: copper-translocating P-type ATPase [Clostridiaceae bacterium]|nr:copper-translocating P-type ATPase [Clostridiaceae bacterium]